MKVLFLLSLSLAALLTAKAPQEAPAPPVALPPVTDAPPGKATAADFIPEKVRGYRPEGLRLWGTAEGNYRVGITTPSAISYVKDGGLGEILLPDIAVFAGSTDGEKVGGKKEQAFQVAVFADGLEPYFKRIESEPGGGKGVSIGEGTWWSHYNFHSVMAWWTQNSGVPLHELQAHWGRLPDKVRLRVMLADPERPHPVSGVAEIKLQALTKSDVTMSVLAKSLRMGLTEQEVIAVLGKPENAWTRAPGSTGLARTLQFQDTQFRTSAKLGHITVDFDDKGRVCFVQVGDLC